MVSLDLANGERSAVEWMQIAIGLHSVNMVHVSIQHDSCLFLCLLILLMYLSNIALVDFNNNCFSIMLLTLSRTCLLVINICSRPNTQHMNETI